MDPNTAKHHLNPSSGEAKNGQFAGVRSGTFWAPKGEEKRAPVRRQKNVTQPSLDKRKNGSLLAMDAKQQNTT